MKIKNACYTIACIVILFLIIRNLYFLCNNAINYNIPNEYMDIANVQLTDSIVNGNNPYDFENDVLNQNFNVYTPLNSVICAGIAAVLHMPGFRVHYVFTLFCLVLCSALIAKYVENNYLKRHGCKKKGLFVDVSFGIKIKSLLISSLAFLCMLTIIQRNHFVSVSTVPDMLGVLVILIIFFIVSGKNKIKNEYIKTLLAAILSVIAYFTKQYFAVVAVTIVMFYLSQVIVEYYLNGKNRKISSGLATAATYVCMCCVLGLISLYVINIFCPLFNVETLYCFLCEGGEADAATVTGIKLSADQMLYILRRFFPLAILFVIGFAGKIKYLLRYKKNVRTNESVTFFSIWDINVIVMFFVLFFVLGKHDGAYLSYHLQLLLPSVIVSGLEEEGIILDLLDENGEARISLIGHIALFLCALYLCLTSYRMGTASVYSETDLDKFRRASEIIETFDKDEVLILTPNMGYYALEKDIPVIGNGHNYMHGMEDGVDRSTIVKFLEKMGIIINLDKIETVAKERSRIINEKIINKEYKVIVVPDGGYVYFSGAEAGYELLEKLTLRTGEEFYDACFYVAQ